MFGRDWTKSKDYEDIDKYPPARQAWEFLRRKPAYKLDCMVGKAVDSFRKKLDSTMLQYFDHLYKNDNIHGKNLVCALHNSVGCELRIAVVIRNLSSVDAGMLFMNSANWVKLRHNLNVKYGGHLIPENNFPADIDFLFKRPELGHRIEVATANDKRISIHPGEAAIIVDLAASISQQTDSVKEQLKALQLTILENRGLPWAEKDRIMLPVGGQVRPFSPLPALSRIVPHHRNIKTRRTTMSATSLYIRLLDALDQREKEKKKGSSLTYMDMYYKFKSAECKEIDDRNDKAIKNKEPEKVLSLEDKAKHYFHPKKKIAERIMNKDYSIIANAEAVPVFSF